MLTNTPTACGKPLTRHLSVLLAALSNLTGDGSAHTFVLFSMTNYWWNEGTEVPNCPSDSSGWWSRRPIRLHHPSARTNMQPSTWIEFLGTRACTLAPFRIPWRGIMAANLHLGSRHGRPSTSGPSIFAGVHVTLIKAHMQAYLVINLPITCYVTSKSASQSGGTIPSRSCIVRARANPSW